MRGPPGGNGKWRRLWWALALLAFVPGCAGHVSPFHAEHADAATSIRVFLPFSPDGLRIGLAVAGRVSGECFTGSLVTSGRSDAWRCMSANRILDPCFEGTEQGALVLACAGSPWTADVELLTPTEALPRSMANRTNLGGAPPWALELANGVRCQFLSGATWGAAGLRVNYGCEGDRGYVIGDVDRSRWPWQALFDPPKGLAARNIGVAVAWY